jgi:tetratricopeptide (TPR) repeat protein
MTMKRFAASILMFFLLMSGTASALNSRELQEAYRNSYNYEKIQNYDSAINALSEVYKAYKSTYTVNLRLGWLYYLKKNYANSLQYYKAAMTIAPKSIEAKLGYTLPLIAQNKYDDAIAVVRQILAADYCNYNGNLKYVYLLRLQKKYDLAIKISTNMLVLYPTDLSYLTELGLSQYGKGDKEKALTTFWNVAVLDPENPTAKGFLSK